MGASDKAADRAGERLVKIRRNEKEIEVKDNDDVLLAELTHAVTMHALLRQLEELGVVMEKFGELLLEGVELIPGWGQAAMVAHLIFSALAFVASPEFEQLKAAFGGDAGELIKQGFEKLKATFSPDVLVRWLLFGPDLSRLPALPALKETDRQKAVTRRYSGAGSPARRLGQVLGRLFRVGIHLGHSVERLHEKFAYPMRRTRLFVLSRPMVAMVLRFLVNNFERLSTVRLEELEIGTEGIAKKVAEEMNQLSGKVSELLAHIQELELPEELIPLNQIVDLTLDLVVHRLGGKYKVAIPILKAGLEKIGAWGRIVSAISDELRSAGMDPNMLWRDLARSELEPIFEGVCEEFAATAGRIVASVPFLNQVVAPAGPDITFAFQPGEFPEVEGFFASRPARPLAGCRGPLLPAHPSILASKPTFPFVSDTISLMCASTRIWMRMSSRDPWGPKA